MTVGVRENVGEAVGVLVEGRLVDVSVAVLVAGGGVVAVNVGVRVGEAVGVLVAEGRFVGVDVGVRESVGDAVTVLVGG